MSETERPQSSFPSRRDFIALGIGAFVVASVPVVLRGRRSLVRRAVPTMGTIADFAVVHGDERYAQDAIDAAIEELRFVDRTMTWFSSDSDVGRANLIAAKQPGVLSPETALVLESALLWAEASGGAFDPCLGRAVALWDVGSRQSPPAADAVRGFAGRGLYKSLELGARGGEPVVVFRDDDVSLDLGGIAKGYGVDRAVGALRSHGIENAIVNVGGDLYAMGTSEDGDPWKVGIRDPQNPDGIIETIEVSDRAVATSGDYIRFFQHGGRRYHHLIDPMTGEPRSSRMRSVTVAAADCMTADAAGTAVFGMLDGQAQALLARRASDAAVVHKA
jgi:thiamine biosynthesis lipoprotein